MELLSQYLNVLLLKNYRSVIWIWTWCQNFSWKLQEEIFCQTATGVCHWVTRFLKLKCETPRWRGIIMDNVPVSWADSCCQPEIYKVVVWRAKRLPIKKCCVRNPLNNSIIGVFSVRMTTETFWGWNTIAQIIWKLKLLHGTEMAVWCTKRPPIKKVTKWIPPMH